MRRTCSRYVLLAAGADARLDVDADLELRVTAPAGNSTSARVTGQGQRVLVEAERRPEVLLAALNRTDVGRAADSMASCGITVAVSGPDGPVATLGAATHSRLGRAISGSSRVDPAPRAALNLALALAARAGATRVITVALAVPVAIAALAMIRWLTRTNRTSMARSRRGPSSGT